MSVFNVLLNCSIYLSTAGLFEIGESNESVSLPSESGGVRGGHHIGHVYI